MMVGLNISKNLVSSAMAESIGSFDAQSTNVAAIRFIVTGQDPAQLVGNANCITFMAK